MTVSNKQISDAIESGVTDAQANGTPEWMGATDAVLNLLIENGECFSSGEIAAHLRTFRPDLVFSVTSSVGEHIRDRFYANTLPLYENPDGSHTPVEQTPRMTGGFTRTPPGTQVFVYGLDYDECQAHEFEVDIPKPGTKVPADPSDAHGLPARPKQAPAPVQHFTTLTPRAAARDLTATIHNDGRCCVARSAVEALLHDTGTGLKGGDSMYVLVDDSDDQARVALDKEPGAHGYQLAASRGRVLFPHPAHPFTPGDAYAVKIDGPNRRLLIDLSVKL